MDYMLPVFLAWELVADVGRNSLPGSKVLCAGVECRYILLLPRTGNMSGDWP